MTATIIGPRTLAQLTSQLAAVDLRRSRDLLDVIDQIVPPGNPVDRGDFSSEPQACATWPRAR